MAFSSSGSVQVSGFLDIIVNVHSIDRKDHLVDILRTFVVVFSPPRLVVKILLLFQRRPLLRALCPVIPATGLLHRQNGCTLLRRWGQPCPAVPSPRHANLGCFDHP